MNRGFKWKHSGSSVVQCTLLYFYSKYKINEQLSRVTFCWPCTPFKDFVFQDKSRSVENSPDEDNHLLCTGGEVLPKPSTNKTDYNIVIQPSCTVGLNSDKHTIVRNVCGVSYTHWEDSDEIIYSISQL